MKAITIGVIIFCISFSLPGSVSGTEKILEDFVTDFRDDPACRERAFTFGIRITGIGEWHVAIDGKGTVDLKKGFPAIPSLFFVMDYKTLSLIHTGKMTALTAMGRARYSDKTPLNFGFMEGYKPAPDILGWGTEFTFHFWTRGTPEIFDFSDRTLSRFVHGAQAKIFYYEKGLRSGWYGIKKGQHINKDPGNQVNPFPTLIIMIDGAADARIGGKTLILKKGMCVHVPANVPHEFWNTREKMAEFIIIMFGKGA